MRIQSSASDWKDYAVSCSYPEKDYLLKKKFVEKVFEMGEIKNVIDLGCNTGKFSIIATLKGCDVLALDSDQQCVNSLYLLSKEKKYSILPLWMDISNPSPAIGWQNTERSDFISRRCWDPFRGFRPSCQRQFVFRVRKAHRGRER